MLNGLKQLERELELKDPENRRIIQTYKNAETRRLDEAVYSPLGRRYPSLNGILGEMRKGYDPIENIEKTKSQIRELEIFKGLAGLLSSIGEDEDAQAVKIMLDKLDPFSELYKRFAPIQEQFYVDLAHAVKSISTQRGVGIEETVGDLPYMDEVSRIVIPTREEAESFQRTSQLFGRMAFDNARGFIAFTKKIGRADEEILEIAKLMPTTKAIKVIQKGIWDYRMQEFDRVYSVL